jgi:autotransporter-associated beta strand protein
MKKNFSDFLKINGLCRYRHLRLWGLVAAWVMGSLSLGFGQNVSATWGANSNTPWYTGSNWVGSSYAGVQGASASANSNIATFTSGYTGTAPAIAMATNSLNLGAISIDNTRTTALSISNSSAANAGSLWLHGATVNSVANTILRNNGTGLLTLQGAASGTMGLPLTNATDNIVTTDNTGGITITAIISGTGKLTKSGTGTGALTLSGINTFSGGVTLNSGLLNINNANGLGTGTFIINGGSFNQTLSTATINLAPTTIPQIWGGDFTFLGNGILGMGSGAVSLTGNRTVTITANTLIVGGVISGAFGLTKAGAGTLSLGNANTYTGKTVINGGLVSMNTDNRFGANPASFTADQITLNGGGFLSSATGSFGSNRGITLGAMGGIFDIATGHTFTLTTVTTGSGTLTKNSTGTLIMTGAHTYTGLTTVNSGTLNLNKTGGGTLPATNNVTVANGGTLVVSTNQTLNNLTVAAGGTVTVNAGVTLTINGTYSVSSNTSGNAGTIHTNGTLQINEGGWPGNTGTFTYGPSGTLVFANTTGPYGISSTDPWWPASSGPANVTVQGGGGINLNGISRTVPSSGTTGTFLLVTGTNAVQGNALTLNGTVQIDGGNFQSSPIYGSSSLLKYNVNGTYGRGNEWVATGVGTIGTTPGYPNNVQLSNNTTLDFPNGSNTARACNGNLTIDAGSSLYADYSGGSVNLTVGGSLNIAGNMSLGGSSGGDLTVKGNFTRTGTFTPNGRAVYFNAASGDQTITGATSFDYIVVDKAAGNVILANSITSNQALTLTMGKISTGSNSVIISSTGSVSRTNGWVIGNLQKNVATGSNVTRTYEVGDATNYTPLSITFANVSTAGNVTATVAAAAHPNFSSSTLNQTKYAQRYWTLTNAGTAFDTYGATFTYASSDLQGGASGGSLNVGRYASSAWTYPSFSNSGSTTTATGLTAFGDFMLAEAGCVNPTAFTVTGGGAYCSGGTGVVIGLSNSETGVQYQLILSATNNGSPVSGTNSAISFGLRTAAGTYTVLGTRTSGGCSTTMTGNAVVSVNPRPTVSVAKVDDNCQVSAGTITVTITGGTPNYSIAACGTTIAPSPAVGTYIPVTGSPATLTTSGGMTIFSNLQGNADYKLTVTDANGCIGQ